MFHVLGDCDHAHHERILIILADKLGHIERFVACLADKGLDAVALHIYVEVIDIVIVGRSIPDDAQVGLLFAKLVLHFEVGDLQ